MGLTFEGTFTALITPFTADGKNVDFEKLEQIVNWQIEQGVNGLVPMGTTGECPTVSHEEHDQVIAAVVKYTAGRVPVIAGTGSNSTAEALRLTKEAKKAGADACLAVNPYYNKPNQAGLIAHFTALNEVGLPIVLYNIPGRTGITMTPQTVAELAKLPYIVAIKEATGSLDQTSEIHSLCDIPILSGDDSLTLPLMSVGASGVVSVLSNASPKMVLNITDNVRKGDFEAAKKAHLQAFELMRTLFIEPNPQPVKKALELMGKCSSAVRLPLVECAPETTEKLEKLLKENNLL